MELYKISKNNLTQLNEISYKLEKDLQNIFEQNLELITGLEFICTEFSIQNQRFDTLAFDKENNAFVIIEYKRSLNNSVFDQGISYLNTLLKFKADFVLEYNEKTGSNFTKKSIDWSQSKVIFVSPVFNTVQKTAVDFKDLNIELWELNRFSDDILVVNNILKSENAPSIKKTNNSAKLDSLKEIKTYTEDDHLKGKSENVIECYEYFKEALYRLLPEIKLEPKKLYIAFKKDKKNITDVEIQKTQLKIYINAKKGTINDPKNLMSDISNIGHWGNGDYQIIIKNTKNIEYIMSLIMQLV